MSDVDDNPFRAPESDLRVEGVLSGTREDLRSVATYQRWLLLCILVYLGGAIGRFAVPPEIQILVIVPAIIAALVGTVFVFLLSTKVYGTLQGVLLAILTLVPCLGLIVLLMINSKATNVLKANGIKVGLLGANPANV